MQQHLSYQLFFELGITSQALHKLSGETRTGVGMRLGIAGRGYKGGVGEKAVQEECLLGRQGERVSVQRDASGCRAGQFQPASVVFTFCSLSSVSYTIAFSGLDVCIVLCDSRHRGSPSEGLKCIASPA